MPVNDFRAVRVVLEPDDFALGSEEPDPPPSDLIDEQTWRGITVFPDDVSIRTSNRNGTALAEVQTIWSNWITATEHGLGKLFDPMLDAGNDLQASIFNAVHGYYRCAFSCLRNVLELMIIGTHSTLTADGDVVYKKGRDGRVEIKFGSVCGQLSKARILQDLHKQLKTETNDSLFASVKESGGRAEGWSKRAYRHLCNYAHSRPGFAEADLWHSNGPIYVPKAFRNWYTAYLETTSLAAIFVLIACPRADHDQIIALFTDDDSINPPIAKSAFRVLTGPR